jgi:hypothetical protein
VPTFALKYIKDSRYMQGNNTIFGQFGARLTHATAWWCSLAVRTKEVSDPPCLYVHFFEWHLLTMGSGHKMVPWMCHNVTSLSQHPSHAVSTRQSVMTTTSHQLSRLYPVVVGVFTCIDVDILVSPPQGCLVDIEMDTSNAKLMVFQTRKGSCRLFPTICMNS